MRIASGWRWDQRRRPQSAGWRGRRRQAAAEPQARGGTSAAGPRVADGCGAVAGVARYGPQAGGAPAAGREWRADAVCRRRGRQATAERAQAPVGPAPRAASGGRARHGGGRGPIRTASGRRSGRGPQAPGGRGTAGSWAACGGGAEAAGDGGDEAACGGGPQAAGVARYGPQSWRRRRSRGGRGSPGAGAPGTGRASGGRNRSHGGQGGPKERGARPWSLARPRLSGAGGGAGLIQSPLAVETGPDPTGDGLWIIVCGRQCCTGLELRCPLWTRTWQGEPPGASPVRAGANGRAPDGRASIFLNQAVDGSATNVNLALSHGSRRWYAVTVNGFIRSWPSTMEPARTWLFTCRTMWSTMVGPWPYAAVW